MTTNDAVHNADLLPEDIVEFLQDVGLLHKEIQIYEYLLIAGAATPSAIARDTAQPRGRIYESMRNLVAKGFARERPTRPIQFCPTPLLTVLTAAQARLNRHLRAVKRGQAIEAARAQPGGSGPASRPLKIRDISVLAGRRACHAELTRMVDNARVSFWIAGGGRFVDRLAKMADFLDHAKAAAMRGVDVRILFPRPAALARALATIDVGEGRKILEPLPADTVGEIVLCATERACLEIVPQPNDDATSRGDDVAIHVNDAAYAARFRRRFDAFTAAKTAARSPWLGPDHGTDLFLAAVKGATAEVLVLGSSEWAEHVRVTADHNGDVFAHAAARGVRLRVVLGPGALTAPEVARLRGTWELRHATSPKMWLTIVDGKEVYQAFTHPTLGGPPQFRKSGEPHEVAFYQRIFERTWETAPPQTLIDASGSDSRPDQTEAAPSAAGLGFLAIASDTRGRLRPRSL